MTDIINIGDEWKGGIEFRADWDSAFLALAFVIAQKSIDPNTVCGAVLVSKDKRILSMGFNGPIRGSDDSKFPLTRPDKYYHVLHAEQNALLQYYGNYNDIQGSTMYVTGRPCHNCLKEMLQKGIRRIVYSVGFAKMVDQKELDIQKKMVEDLNDDVEIIEHNNIQDIRNVLTKSLNYIDYKIQES